MKKILLFVSVVVFTLTMTGCASIFSNKISNIPVRTSPENANISVYAYSGGKIFEGKSPCMISLNKKELVEGKVIISQKGYKDVQINLGKTIEPWALANGCFFILPGLAVGGGIDYLNGNLLKAEVETINIILEPDTIRTTNISLKTEEYILSKNVSITIQKNNSEYLIFINN